MSNPNSTVAAARNKKSVMVSEHPFKTQGEADDFAVTERKAGKTVRVTSFKIGPRNAPVRKYMARIYESAK